MNLADTMTPAPASGEPAAPQEIWDKLADSLEARLLAQPKALALHFLKSATPEQLAAVAGEALPSTENTRAGVVAHLSARLQWTSVQA